MVASIVSVLDQIMSREWTHRFALLWLCLLEELLIDTLLAVWCTSCTQLPGELQDWMLLCLLLHP